jgi:hypothetical protein
MGEAIEQFREYWKSKSKKVIVERDGKFVKVIIDGEVKKVTAEEFLKSYRKWCEDYNKLNKDFQDRTLFGTGLGIILVTAAKGHEAFRHLDFRPVKMIWL